MGTRMTSISGGSAANGVSSVPVPVPEERERGAGAGRDGVEGAVEEVREGVGDGSGA